ncbi:MAG TPA: acyltransferase [Acidimicrobiales bacterium]|nr:acyltransferase [Acidimicrobiales bacterium]
MAHVLDRPGAPPSPSGDDADSPAAPPRLPYNPALDGIRGLAVAAVLLFHAGFPWARGGFLGVSTFFTLSGFLITSLLLVERRATGRVALGRFWSRRLRRLFPAAALTLVGVAAGSRVAGALATEGLAGDLLASLAQVANWRFVLADQSYGDLFAAPSPVLHFWSLAIEEQFYWLFPLVTVAVLALGRGSLRVYVAALAGLVAVAGAATLAHGVDGWATAYYATYVRMGEVLLGALLAVAATAGVLRRPAVARAAAVAGVPALAASVWAWGALDHGSPVLARGGLLAYAAASTALVAGASVPGPVRTALSWAPLRLLGVVSYGVYLVHWPIFLVLDADRTGLDRAPLFALRVVVTLAVAAASYVVVERPIRRGWSPPRLPMPAVAAGAVAASALVVTVVPVSAPGGFTDEQLAYLEALEAAQAAEVPEGARVGIVFGDSTMLQTSWGLSAWGRDTELLALPGAVNDLLGCGVTRGGERRERGRATVAPEGCDGWEEDIPQRVAEIREEHGRLDFAIAQTGPWDVTDRRLPGDDRWRAPGDPVYDRYLYEEIAAATDLFLEEGLVVVWLLAPHIEVGRNEEPPPDPPYPESDPARMDRLNEILQRVADERHGVVTVDLQGLLRSLPGGEMDPALRPDGVHFTPESATELAPRLGPLVLDALEAEPVAGSSPSGEGDVASAAGDAGG